MHISPHSSDGREAPWHHVRPHSVLDDGSQQKQVVGRHRQVAQATAVKAYLPFGCRPDAWYPSAEDHTFRKARDRPALARKIEVRTNSNHMMSGKADVLFPFSAIYWHPPERRGNGLSYSKCTGCLVLSLLPSPGLIISRLFPCTRMRCLDFPFRKETNKTAGLVQYISYARRLVPSIVPPFLVTQSAPLCQLCPCTSPLLAFPRSFVLRASLCCLPFDLTWPLPLYCNFSDWCR